MQLNISNTIICDVAVFGGGPAGFSAAVAAARMGAKTMLFEQSGILGGNMTQGGIPAPAFIPLSRIRVMKKRTCQHAS